MDNYTEPINQFLQDINSKENKKENKKEPKV